MIAKMKKNKNLHCSLPLFPIFIGGLFLIVIGFLIFSNFNIGRRRTETIERIEVLREEIQILEEKNQELRVEISRAGGEDFLEEKAREQLGLKKPGEEVVVILAPEIEEKPVEKEKTFWEKFWGKLGF